MHEQQKLHLAHATDWRLPASLCQECLFRVKWAGAGEAQTRRSLLPRFVRHGGSKPYEAVVVRGLMPRSVAILAGLRTVLVSFVCGVSDLLVAIMLQYREGRNV